MLPKGFHVQFQGRRGLPAVLPMIVMAIIASGLIALFIFVGLAVAVVGLGVFGIASLYYGVRRKLLGTQNRPSVRQDQGQDADSASATSPLRQEGRVIEVEAITLDREQRQE